MEKEMNDLQNQLKEILNKKETATKRLGDYRIDFDIISSKIKKEIADINELKLAENRLLQKIHSLESNGIDKAISKSLEEKNIFLKLFDVIKHKINKTEINIPLVSYREVADSLKKNEQQDNVIELAKEPILETAKVVEVVEKTAKNEPIKKKKNLVIKPKSKSVQKTKSPKEVVSVSTQKDISSTKTIIVEEEKAPINKNETVVDINTEISPSASIEIKSVDESDTLDLPTSKQEGMELWVKYDSPTYDESKLVNLYQEYVDFLEKQFGDKLTKEITYSQKGPSFKLAFRKASSFNSLKN